jgi:hypothetical protein
MTKRGKTLLWLDDLRNPYQGSWLHEYAPDFETKGAVIWVKSYKEFTQWITENELPTLIAFDHDLADEHYTPEKYWNDYEASKEYQDSQDYKEMTGLDCAKWLVDFCMDNSKNLPRWIVQSANPVGADNINGYLISYLKNVEKR